MDQLLMQLKQVALGVKKVNNFRTSQLVVMDLLDSVDHQIKMVKLLLML